VQGQDEKINNVSRLVKLLQSYSEAQEEDTQGVKAQMQNLNFRLEDFINFVKNEGSINNYNSCAAP